MCNCVISIPHPSPSKSDQNFRYPPKAVNVFFKEAKVEVFDSQIKNLETPPRIVVKVGGFCPENRLRRLNVVDTFWESDKT